MRDKFILNGKEYKTIELTYGAFRKMEKLGVNVTDFGNSIITTMSAYVALCIGCSLDRADEEINEHIMTGGDINDIVEVVAEAQNESGFLKALAKPQSETVMESPKPKRKTKESE